MNKFGIVLVIILLFFSSTKTSKAQDSLLISRLNQAVEDDQEIRLQLRSALNSGANSHFIDSLVLEMHSVDSINFVFLKETVEKHGFPGISIIGSSGAQKILAIDSASGFES